MNATKANLCRQWGIDPNAVVAIEERDDGVEVRHVNGDVTFQWQGEDDQYVQVVCLERGQAA